MSNAPVANYHIPSTRVLELALSFDGSQLAVGLSDGTVSLWDRRGMHGFIASLGGYACNPGRLEFSPASYHLAFLSDDGGIRLWNGLKGEYNASLSFGPAESVSSHTRSQLAAPVRKDLRRFVKFVFSHSGSRLAALTKDESGHDLALWNGDNGKSIGVAIDVGHELAISDDGSLIATAGQEKVLLWSGNSLSRVGNVRIGSRIFSLAFSDGTLAIGFYSKVKLYDLKTRAAITTSVDSVPYSLALSPTRLAASIDSRSVGLRDIQSMKASASASMERTRIVSVTSLAFSPDCSRLASGFGDGTVELWDTGRTEQVKDAIKHHSQEITALSFSTDGEQLASGSRDGSVRLWVGKNLAPSGILDRIFRDPYPLALAFSTRLIAAATSSTIALFDFKALNRICSLEQGGNQLSFSSDGSRLACTNRSCVTLWDVETYTQIAQFSLTNNTHALVFSPDHSWLAASTPSGLFRVLSIKRVLANAGHKTET